MRLIRVNGDYSENQVLIHIPVYSPYNHDGFSLMVNKWLK